MDPAIRNLIERGIRLLLAIVAAFIVTAIFIAILFVVSQFPVITWFFLAGLSVWPLMNVPLIRRASERIMTNRFGSLTTPTVREESPDLEEEP